MESMELLRYHKRQFGHDVVFKRKSTEGQRNQMREQKVREKIKRCVVNRAYLQFFRSTFCSTLVGCSTALDQ